MVRHDLENLLHQHCPPLMAEEWLPINGLGAHKVCLSAPPDVLSGRSHWFPQRLKPFNLLVVKDGLKPVPFNTGTTVRPKACSSLPLFHHFSEVPEEVVGVVGAGAGLRVILDAEQWQRALAKAFQRVVVQVDMGKLDLALVDRIRIDGKVMVVRGDLHFARLGLLYWMVSAVVAEL